MSLGGNSFNIKSVIESVFDQSGFDKAESAMQRLEDISSQTGLSVEELGRRFDATTLRMDDNGQIFDGMQQKYIDVAEAADILGKEQIALRSAAGEMGTDLETVNHILGRTQMELRQNSQGAAEFKDMMTGAMHDSQQAMARADAEVRQFQFEFLSLMFLMMEGQRVISSMMDNAFEAAGVFDIWGDTLEIFFLPIALVLQQIMLRISTTLMGVDERVRLVVGGFLLLASVFAVAFKWGTLVAMNWNSILKILGSKGKAIVIAVKQYGALGAAKLAVAGAAAKLTAAIGAVVGALSLPVLAIGAVIAALGALAAAWHNNWFDIRQRTGKAVKWIGEQYGKLIDFADPVIDSLDWVIEQLNRIPGINIADGPLSRGHDRIQQMLENTGQAAIDSGEAINEMGDDHEGIFERVRGGLSSRIPGLGTPGTPSENPHRGAMMQNQVNDIDVDARGTDLDEKGVAKETVKEMQKMDVNTVRGGR